ncbi:MAG: beta-ketoacyl-[acyl-carrier-protein] synthase family protein [Verrucomicrobiales bacterium]|jgi:3-oxoacyl-[acyl-carrier-protein] synthase II|nr:beta-ketoacyl-[acyl-carrier-protein] synthase family protein [Verrucomicrobiales bacterium]
MNSGKQRVVISGIGAVSPYGAGAELLTESLLAGRSGVVFLPELTEIPAINSHVAGVVPELNVSVIPRHFRRSMTKMSLYATLAAQEALRDADHERAPEGMSFLLGSTMSSMAAWLAFAEKFLNKQLELVKTTAVFQMMNHSPLANVAQALDIQGPGYGNCTACATGLMNVGMAAQLIASGLAETVLCGGTDEYHPIMTGCFSIMNAASDQFNDRPELASRPFDRQRGGIVCSEGCGMLVVESLDSAAKRGVKIHAEIIGFGSNTETKNIATPSAASIGQCIRLALADADLDAAQVNFVNAHATSTPVGDAEECAAIGAVFGANTPVNSLKGHLGHTMAASGCLELIASIRMMQRGTFAPTLNLTDPDPECAAVHHLREVTPLTVNILQKNSFALGGTNCSLLVKRWQES